MSDVTQPPRADAAQHWQRVKVLLAEALELEADARQAFVDSASGSDEALRDELLVLLAAEQEAPAEALEPPPVDWLLDALQDHATQAWIGRRLGPYRLAALIAQGGMGQVYRAERADGQYEQQVAVKLMHHGTGRPDAAERFVAERQILASLDHPNLAKVLDGGVTDDGVPYFVMEFVAGLPIDRYCDDQALAVPARLELFRTVCRVVHYAHLKGVVHRDLKAANILVTHEGVVKLVDFGIAKRLDPAGPAADTATALRAMTLAYASPEQVRGGPITPASDLYSLGVVLYRLLTGTGPYPAELAGDYELARAICDLEPLPPSRAPGPPGRPAIAPDLDAVVLMALRKDPARRYASAEHLADDLFRHLEHLPVQARRGAWGYRASRFLLRHRAAVAAAALANLALLAGLALAAYQTLEANRQRERAQQHLRDTRQLANVLILDVYQAISSLPGSTAARELVVRNARSYLQRAAGESAGDPSQRLEVAKGLRNVGDLLGRYGYANLGDARGAVDSYDAALALLGSGPQGAALPQAAVPQEMAALYQQEMAALYQRKGSTLSLLGQQPQADAALRQGLVLAAAVARQRPADVDAQMNLATLHGQHSEVLVLLGDLPAAAAELDIAVRMLEALAARAPGEPQVGLSLATAYMRRGEAWLDRSKEAAAGERALGEFRRSRQVLEQFAAVHPADTSLARHQAFNDHILGETLLRLKQPRQAAEHFHRAVQAFTRLSDADPLDHQFRSDLVKAYSRLSTALDALGDLPASVAAARTALKHAGQLPDSALANTVVSFTQGQAYYALGQALEHQAAQLPPGAAARQRREACGWYRRSLPLVLAIRQQMPQARTSLAPEAVQAALQPCEKN
jgi:non-specific serine/threonine protein kinase/serine/threonine-protein kinase